MHTEARDRILTLVVFLIATITGTSSYLTLQRDEVDRTIRIGPFADGERYRLQLGGECLAEFDFHATQDDVPEVKLASPPEAIRRVDVDATFNPLGQLILSDTRLEDPVQSARFTVKDPFRPTVRILHGGTRSTAVLPVTLLLHRDENRTYRVVIRHLSPTPESLKLDFGSISGLRADHVEKNAQPACDWKLFESYLPEFKHPIL